MKYNIRIEDQIFSVEIVDINSRPVKVNVDGDTYEVWPETLKPEQKPSKTTQPPTDIAAESLPASKKSLPVISSEPVKTISPDQTKGLRAPIPGIIIKVTVQAGSAVEFGQELCVLEAMKMNNLIRAPRAGTIAVVHVSEGKHVKHGDLLMEFA